MDRLEDLETETIDGIVTSLVVNFLRESNHPEIASKLEEIKTSALVSLRGVKLQHLLKQFYAKPNNCRGCSRPSKLDIQENGPFYDQLGFAASLDTLRMRLETRFHISNPNEMVIVQAFYCPKPQLSETGCPLANVVVGKSCDAEKVLVVVKNRYLRSSL